MDNLIAKPLRRGELSRGDWISSLDHLSDEGRAAFAARVRGYRAAVQKAKVVTSLKARKA